MHIKATIVAYAFSVQCFENATIVAYAGLRVKLNKTKALVLTGLPIENTPNFTESMYVKGKQANFSHKLM